MRNTSKVLLTGILLLQGAAVGAQMTVYQLDDGGITYAANASEATEPLDNWFGNVFTAQDGANLIARVDFGVFTTTPDSTASVVIYRVTAPGGNPAQGATRLYTQSFTPLIGDGYWYYYQSVVLASPVIITPGDRFLVAIFIPNVASYVFPYLVDTSGFSLGSYWDRSAPNAFNLDDLSQAIPLDQGYGPGGFVPGPGHVIIRAVGFATNTPPVSLPGLYYDVACVGVDTQVQLDGSASFDPKGGPVTYAWTSDCPGARFDNPTLATPVLTLNSLPGCPGNCSVTLTVTDSEGTTDTATAPVAVYDWTPPTVVCPEPMVVEFTDENGAAANFVVTASDPCSAVNLAVEPASGSLFPIGTTAVTAFASDECGNWGVCGFTVTVLGARGVKQNVLNELLALRVAVTDRQDRHKLDDAIADLTASLSPALWMDETHVAARHGGMVFQRGKQAVQKFEELIKAKKTTIPKATLQNFIGRILRADRLLAVVAIDEAVADGTDAKQNTLAQKELARGDACAAAGKFSDAIEGYRIAWMKALQPN